MKFSIKDFFSECDQIRSFLRIWSHLLKKCLLKTSFFVLGEYGKKIGQNERQSLKLKTDIA